MKKKLTSLLLSLMMVFNLALPTISSTAFAANQPIGTEIPNSKITWFINQDNVHLRRTADATNTDNIIGQVNEGDTLIRVSTTPVESGGYRWYRVRMTSGAWKGWTGYVVVSYVSSRVELDERPIV